MDANTAQVWGTFLTVIGAVGATLLGVAAGSWLEGRRQHDDTLRDAYARLEALGRAGEVNLKTTADTEHRDEDVATTWGSDIQSAFAIVELIGSAEAVEAARFYIRALGAAARPWLADVTPEITEQRADASARIRNARLAYIDSARRDLGRGPLHKRPDPGAGQGNTRSQ